MSILELLPWSTKSTAEARAKAWATGTETWASSMMVSPSESCKVLFSFKLSKGQN